MAVTNEQLTDKEDEIDLLALLNKILKAKKRIAIFTLLFMIIGVVAAFTADNEYTATTIMLPQTSDKGGNGGLGGLAALAGINLSGGSSEAIPLKSYDKIIASIPFRKRLVQTKLTFKDLPNDITYEEYLTKYSKPSLMGRIMGIFRSKPAATTAPTTGVNDTIITTLTPEERGILNSIGGHISLDINEKDGYINLSFRMPEALPAAQMLQNAQQLLQEVVTNFKLQKAKEEYDFVAKRCIEAEKEFKSKQYAVAQFQDQNRNLFSNLPQTRLQQLQAEYNLAFSVYTELAKQLETKRIKLKEDQPIFTIIEPVSVPNERTKPKKTLIIAIWTFAGLIIGIGSVFLKDFRNALKEKQVNNND